MATQLFKLVIDANTTTDIEINPEVDKYFYQLIDLDRTDDILTIPATIPVGAPITLIVTNFTPTSDSNTIVTT